MCTFYENGNTITRLMFSYVDARFTVYVGLHAKYILKPKPICKHQKKSNWTTLHLVGGGGGKLPCNAMWIVELKLRLYFV